MKSSFSPIPACAPNPKPVPVELITSMRLIGLLLLIIAGRDMVVSGRLPLGDPLLLATAAFGVVAMALASTLKFKSKRFNARGLEIARRDAVRHRSRSCVFLPPQFDGLFKRLAPVESTTRRASVNRQHSNSIL